ncbi:MAG TPA: hypothetical protein VFA77_02180, partial [Candidatus Eisenbacteria bacterium]|nr:hypothetical protein [Candidatus Eisenbacteria bacterium]
MLTDLFAHGGLLSRQLARERLALILIATFLSSGVSQLFSAAAGVNIIVHSEPLHSGRISPKLFGNFVELLDDVAPGLRAEMLNDRGFAGVTPCLKPFYYDGAPNFCDRQWETNSSWNYDTQNSFHGCRSAKLAVTDEQSASLTQSGIALRNGMTYRCTGWFRGDPNLKASIILKALSPARDWIIQGRKALSGFSPEWRKHSVEITSIGQTDRAVFELRGEGAGSLW